MTTNAWCNFLLRKRRLARAILAVNDLFYMALINVECFFSEGVALRWDDVDRRYMPRVNFIGHSRYKHRFDFVVSKAEREELRQRLAA